MADEKDRSLEALEKSFIEFSRKVSKSLESLGKELDSIHKRMADGEAASVRTSADLGAFKELVRDDLEELDDRVDDALFTPSHYGPSGDGAMAAYAVRAVGTGGSTEFEIYLPQGCLVVAGTEVDVASETNLDAGSEPDWYKLGFDSGPVYMKVRSEHDEGMLANAEDGEVGDAAGGYHYDRVASVSVTQVELSETDDSLRQGPDDPCWSDCMKICDISDEGEVTQVTLGTIVLHGPPCETMLCGPRSYWQDFEYGAPRVEEDDPEEATAGDLLHLVRAPDGCSLFSVPLQVKASGTVSARLQPSADPSQPNVLEIVGFAVVPDESSDGGTLSALLDHKSIDRTSSTESDSGGLIEIKGWKATANDGTTQQAPSFAQRLIGKASGTTSRNGVVVRSELNGGLQYVPFGQITAAAGSGLKLDAASGATDYTNVTLDLAGRGNNETFSLHTLTTPDGPVKFLSTGNATIPAQVQPQDPTGVEVSVVTAGGIGWINTANGPKFVMSLGFRTIKVLAASASQYYQYVTTSNDVDTMWKQDVVQSSRYAESSDHKFYNTLVPGVRTVPNASNLQEVSVFEATAHSSEMDN